MGQSVSTAFAGFVVHEQLALSPCQGDGDFLFVKVFLAYPRIVKLHPPDAIADLMNQPPLTHRGAPTHLDFASRRDTKSKSTGDRLHLGNIYYGIYAIIGLHTRVLIKP